MSCAKRVVEQKSCNPSINKNYCKLFCIGWPTLCTNLFWASHLIRPNLMPKNNSRLNRDRGTCAALSPWSSLGGSMESGGNGKEQLTTKTVSNTPCFQSVKSKNRKQKLKWFSSQIFRLKMHGFG